MTFSVIEPGNLPLDGGKRTLEVTHRFLIGTKEDPSGTAWCEYLAEGAIA